MGSNPGDMKWEVKRREAWPQVHFKVVMQDGERWGRGYEVFGVQCYILGFAATLECVVFADVLDEGRRQKSLQWLWVVLPFL